MKHILIAAIALLVCVLTASAQSKSNDVIYSQIKSSDAGRHITLTYDAASNTSKIMAVASNFSDRDADNAGILAMNFAAGTYYAGSALERSPDPILLSFWVLSNKPRFAASHRFTVANGLELLDLGEGRYAAKPQQRMEYLNFELSRADLAEIVSLPRPKFRLGENEFTFIADHVKMLSDLLKLTDAAR
jgi:hypothetical protein